MLIVADEGWFHLLKPGSVLHPSPRTLWGLLTHPFSKNELRKPSLTRAAPARALSGSAPQTGASPAAGKGLAYPCALAPSSGPATGLRK